MVNDEAKIHYIIHVCKYNRKKNIKGIKQLQQVKTGEKLSNNFVKAFWQGVGILKQLA